MFIRYPGSKAKIYDKILRFMPADVEQPLPLWRKRWDCYCEPFVGSGAVGWHVLESLAGNVDRVLFNDLDPGIAAMWKVVRDTPKDFLAMVRDFRPSKELFYQFKEEDGDPRLDPLYAGFRKLALHQMSFSGLGYKSGGPLGGRKQSNEYNTNCRWQPSRIAKKAIHCHNLSQRFKRFEVCCDDFSAILCRVPQNSIVYLDPPYYVKGEALYKHYMKEDDHVRLAELLKECRFQWVLSYDDHPRIRELYSWASVHSIEMTPTMAVAKGKRRKNQEIIIRPC